MTPTIRRFVPVGRLQASWLRNGGFRGLEQRGRRYCAVRLVHGDINYVRTYCFTPTRIMGLLATGELIEQIADRAAAA